MIVSYAWLAERSNVAPIVAASKLNQNVLSEVKSPRRG
jgi:hypothetical protein